MLRALRAQLARPGLGWRLAALGMLLLVPSLWNGLVLDDWWHRRMILTGLGMAGTPTHPLDLFSFFPDDPHMRAQLLEDGIWPWWGVARAHIEFFRPVTSLTHLLDYALWPERPALMHLHSMLWYAALVVAVTAFLRRFLAAEVAGLGALMYAVCDGHALAASWLATRSAIVAALLSVVALIFHDRWRRDGWRHGAWLGPSLFLVALCAGELALGTLAFLFAHALFLDQRRWYKLAPYALIAVAWQIFYRVRGYGASGPGVYSDPAHDPVGFAWDLVVRTPVLLFSRLVAPLADGWPFMTRTMAMWTAVGAALALAAFIALVWRELRVDRAAKFLALGAMLAIVPAAAVVPSDRVLMLVGVGVSGALASWIARVHESRLTRGVAVALLLRHAVIGALLLPPRSMFPRIFDQAMARAMHSAPHDAALAGETLVIVNAPHVFFANMLPLWRMEHEGTLPARVRCLGTTTQAVSIERPSETELVLRVEDGYLDRPADELTWSRREPRPAGFTVELNDMRFEVVRATADGRPQEVRVQFGSSPRPLRWIAWVAGGYRAFELPPVKGSTRLEPISKLLP